MKIKYKKSNKYNKRRNISNIKLKYKVKIVKILYMIKIYKSNKQI